jgi:hypothetical protein
MPQKPETLFRKKVVPLLKALPETHVMSIQQVARCGDPDLVLCVRGHFIALELKKDDRSKPTRLQRHILEKIEKAGGVSLVVSPENWERVYTALRDYATRPDHL